MPTVSVQAIGNLAAEAPLQSLTIARRDVTPHDVEIEILYCGVCHSDLHQARGEWGGTVYPCVPGHEIVGRVVRVGAHVKAFREGDLAAVGCLVDSCRECQPCHDHQEQFCEHGATYTYNSPDKHLGGHTYGGYSQRIVVDEGYVLRVPDNLDPAAAAPLLCAGITTYSPLKRWKVGPGQKVGVVGLGGLGHMGIKLAKAMGAYVVVFTTSPSKAEDARRLGADEVALSTDPAQMKQWRMKLDFVLDTVSAPHSADEYLSTLKLDGTMVLVGLPTEPLAVSAFNVIVPRRNFTGSSIGGIQETQEMLDFCSEHNIVSDIELIRADQVNEAWERLLKGDVKYRFVIDMGSLGQ
ncbi:NAD(P)-dependent alcohol dehydrogenase [Siphonobacter aquaeclarae]|uniref:Uncharacterized zinc-type alcohol dehydrogenase-like protein n=1 Tax=Siphonobacter aquaeclarae TaxID=563176 RepID=A0A1G9I1Y3_9BACT|nr:NAD(P)-dependent alcohol dehydrogenase [Siphonobacter aquaeclarae]MBO9638657.1 NAD(P)-dependent alcohol dehydrogenase [Siphonobacter aquaeclarae]SDL19248.1 uncharacterized zinc-type alcohol dehydrogenase-like protein [Siphonobacter aquaeclarae]